MFFLFHFFLTFGDAPAWEAVARGTKKEHIKSLYRHQTTYIGLEKEQTKGLDSPFVMSIRTFIGAHLLFFLYGAFRFVYDHGVAETLDMSGEGETCGFL